MTVLLAIDPGTTQSGWVVYDASSKEVKYRGVLDNDEMLSQLKFYAGKTHNGVDALAIEMIASYGMAVGREVFETCVWIGRFMQAWREPKNVRLVYRKDVKLHLCGSPKAKDQNIRQAILDLFPRVGGGAVPQVGTKNKPGPLFGVSTHIWPALGVAITAAHQMKHPAPARRRVRLL